MKRNILISFIPLIFYCFTPNQVSPAQEEFKFVFLTKKDWKELEKISYVGKNRVTVVNKTIMLNVVNETQYKTTKEPFSKKQIKKLKEILSKYGE